MFEYTHELESHCSELWTNLRWNGAAAIARAIISPNSPIEFGAKVKEQACTLALRAIYAAETATPEVYTDDDLPEYNRLIEFMNSRFIWDFRLTDYEVIVRIWDFN